MIVHTARYTYRGPDRLDITRRGNDRQRTEGDLLAPSAAILWPALAAMRSSQDKSTVFSSYRAQYLDELRARYRMRQAEWQALLARPELTLVCFCEDANLCHRKLAAEVLMKVGRGKVVYAGERTTTQLRLF